MAETSDFVLSEEEIGLIIRSHKFEDEDKYIIKHVDIMDLNNGKIIGFIAEYWMLQVELQYEKNTETKLIRYFIKAISRNAGKAAIIKEFNLFKKECDVYSALRKSIHYQGIKPWCATYVTHFDDSLVLLDMTALNYRNRNKLQKFDEAHTKQALSTLARLHASSLIFEETKRTDLHNKKFTVLDEFASICSEAGYTTTSPWFLQCMKSSLECLKKYSKYSNDLNTLTIIEEKWTDVWCSALNIQSEKYRKVITHNDLWNNNLMFHYRTDCATEPDDCILVDFQVVGFGPPTADVLQLLYCNLMPKYRKENLDMFLNHYYGELELNINLANISIRDILPREEFFETAEMYTKWAMISWGCLVQLIAFDHDDEATSQLFQDENQFTKILTEDKTTFVLNMSQKCSNYKDTLLDLYEEIADTYCLIK